MSALWGRLLQRDSRSDVHGVFERVLVGRALGGNMRRAGSRRVVRDGHDGRQGHIFLRKRQEKSAGVRFCQCLLRLRRRLLLSSEQRYVHSVFERVLVDSPYC